MPKKATPVGRQTPSPQAEQARRKSRRSFRALQELQDAAAAYGGGGSRPEHQMGVYDRWGRLLPLVRAAGMDLTSLAVAEKCHRAGESGRWWPSARPTSSSVSLPRRHAAEVTEVLQASTHPRCGAKPERPRLDRHPARPRRATAERSLVHTNCPGRVRTLSLIVSVTGALQRQQIPFSRAV
jgi:hypothetical protein